MSDITANLALTKAQLLDQVGPDVLTVMATNFDAIDGMFKPSATTALSTDLLVSGPVYSPVITGSFQAHQPTVIMEIDSSWTTEGVAKFVPTLWVGANISPPLPGTSGVVSYPLPSIGGGDSAAWAGGRRIVTGLTVGETVNYQITLRALIGTTHLLSADTASQGLTPPPNLTGAIAISADGTEIYAASSTKVYAITAGRDTIDVQTIVRASVTFSASALIYSPADYLYAITTTSSPGTITNTISLLSIANLATLNTLSPTMSIIWNLVDAALSPDGSLLYTADGSSGTISKFSGASNPASAPTVVSSVTLPSPFLPTSMAISPDGSTLAISAQASGHNTTVFLVNTSTMSVNQSFTVGAAVPVPRPAWESNSSGVWIASYGHPGQVRRVIAATGLLDSSAGSVFGPAITGIAVGNSNEVLYVIGNSSTSGDAQWAVFSIPDGTAFTTLNREDGARNGIVVSDDGFTYSVINGDDIDIVLGGIASCGASVGTTLLTGDYFMVNIYGGS